MIWGLHMEIAAKNEILIHTVGLSGFKALAHTHWVLSPLPHCTQGGWAPRGVEKGPCWPLYWAHFTLCGWHLQAEDWGSKELQVAKYVSQTFTKQSEYCKEQITWVSVGNFKQKKENQLSKSPPSNSWNVHLISRELPPLLLPHHYLFSSWVLKWEGNQCLELDSLNVYF